MTDKSIKLPKFLDVPAFFKRRKERQLNLRVGRAISNIQDNAVRAIIEGRAGRPELDRILKGQDSGPPIK